MKFVPFPVLIGAVLGSILFGFGWLPAALLAAVPLLALILWRRPEYGLYLFIAVVIILTDAMDKDVEGIFAIKDVKIVQGLPPMLITFFLAMSLIYFFKLYFIERKESLIAVRYGFIVILILLLATATGRWRGWNPIDLRVDFYNVLFPVLCFYLCANVLNTREKVHAMLGVIFIVGVIDACILTAYYLNGNGWPYGIEGLGSGRIVTQDTKTLMVFVTMTITIYSVSLTRILTGWRRVFALVGCLPMIFAILFSFRRSFWLGTIASLIVFYIMSSRFEKRKTLAWVWIGIMLLTTPLLFAGNATNMKLLDPFVRRVLTLTDSKQSSNVHHLLESQQTLKDIFSSPILGLGLGSSHSPVFGIDWEADKQPLRIVHNTFLLIWMKLGLPGLLFFMWVLVKYILVLLTYRKRIVSSHSGAIIAATGSALGLWLVLLLTGPVMAYWYQTFMISIFAAIVLTLIREEQREKTEENGNALRVLQQEVLQGVMH
ncbi:MAG: O-antigen ligase family protein [Deltaproteobacteria bacterium]|nr:O-antigen ligase family protein [Deltaproteobacteria bacterium]